MGAVNLPSPQSLKEQITFLVTCAHKGDAVDPVVSAILSAVKASLPYKQSELRIPRMGIGHPRSDDYVEGWNDYFDAMTAVLESDK